MWGQCVGVVYGNDVGEGSVWVEYRSSVWGQCVGVMCGSAVCGRAVRGGSVWD